MYSHRRVPRFSETYRQYEWGQHQNPRLDFPWGFSIPAQSPLAFRPRVLDGHQLRFDLYGHQRWRRTDDPAIDLLVVCRVWALDLDDMYRSDWDPDRIFDELDHARGRVLVRFHYDKAQAGQDGPEFHLQVGGITEADELCWLHPDISVPRLATHPIDFTLGTEMVISTLYGVDDAVFRDPSMLDAIRLSQSSLLATYFENAARALRDGTRVLRSLWNPASP